MGAALAEETTAVAGDGKHGVIRGRQSHWRLCHGWRWTDVAGRQCTAVRAMGENRVIAPRWEREKIGARMNMRVVKGLTGIDGVGEEKPRWSSDVDHW